MRRGVRMTRDRTGWAVGAIGFLAITVAAFAALALWTYAR